MAAAGQADRIQPARVGQVCHKFQAGSWFLLNQVRCPTVMRGGSGAAAPSFFLAQPSFRVMWSSDLGRSFRASHTSSLASML